MHTKRGSQQDTRKTREPSYQNPEMQKIAKQIVDLRNRESTAGIPMHELFDNSFLLPAQLGDARRKERGQEEMLVAAYKSAWDQQNVKAAYGEGKVGDVSKKGAHHKDDPSDTELDPALLAMLHPEASSDDADVTPCRDLLAVHFDPRAIDMRLLRSLIKNIDHGGEAQWRLRAHDLDEAKIPEGIRALLYLDLLAGEARMLMKGWLKENQRPDPFSPPDYLSAKAAQEAYTKKLSSLIKPKGFTISYLKGLEERLSGMVTKQAQSLYEDQAEEMMNLWRAVNYLISSKFPQGFDVGGFRQSVYEALKNREIQKAKNRIRPHILRNEDAFTPAAKHTLGVTEEEIKAMRMERGKTAKMTSDEKAEYERQKKQTQEAEQLQPLRPYIGRALYDAVNDRLIYCIGFGKISRTRKSYDKDTHTNIKTSSNVPAMEVRYFPRQKSDSSAQARKENGLIGPGEFLTRIQKGEYKLLEGVSLDRNATEIDVKLFPEK